MFSKAVEAAVGNEGTVLTLESQVTLDIRDIDGYSDEAKITEVSTREYPDLVGKCKAKLTMRNKQGLKLATVKMDQAHANKLFAG